MARWIDAAAALTLSVAAWLAAARGAVAHGNHESVDRGSVTYQKLCASCHGVKGRGDGPRAADGLARPADLTTIRARYGGTFDRRAVAAWIDGRTRPEAHGSPEMPVWGEQGLRASPGQGGVGEAFSPCMEELLDFLGHVQQGG